MSREIPQVVRAAAGLAATVLDEARKLPETLPGLPVRVVGLTMQTAMWLQQQYTGLVARGDEVFTGIRGEDEPGLATFDEDLPAAAAPAPAGFRDSAFDRVEVSEEELVAGLPEDDVALPDPAAAAAAAAADAAAGDAPAPGLSAEDTLEELAIEELVDDELAGLPQEPAPEEVVAAVQDITAQVEAADLPAAPDGVATEDAGAVEDALLESDAAQAAAAPGAAPETVAEEVDVLTPDGGVATVEATVTDEGVAAPETGPAAEATDEGGTPVAAATGVRTDVDEDAGPPADEGTAGAQAAGTAPVEGYDGWSIAQLRGRLRGYAPSTVQRLLDYEEATRSRAPYVRMLRNRLEKGQTASA
ncbi:lipid droplet-associated protein [Geodermatophilus sp. SYSU D00815]